jgi:hypothetical protein
MVDELEADSATALSPNQPKMQTKAVAHPGKFPRTGLTESALATVTELFGPGHMVTTPMVRDRLIERGFPNPSKNFNILVGTSLKRLVKRGLLVTKLVRHKRYYAPAAMMTPPVHPHSNGAVNVAV